jgi:hypothetical protein
MLSSIVINGILGFGMLLAILYCQGDISAAAESPTGYPFVAIFASGVQSLSGATVMVSIVIFMAWCNAIGCLASASRMMWSFARDKGLPFSSTLSKVIYQLRRRFCYTFLTWTRYKTNPCFQWQRLWLSLFRLPFWGSSTLDLPPCSTISFRSRWKDSSPPTSSHYACFFGAVSEVT